MKIVNIVGIRNLYAAYFLGQIDLIRAALRCVDALGKEQDMIEIDHKSHLCAITAFAKRDFVHFRGLPRFCSLADVTRHFRRLNDGCGQARLGQRKASFVMVAAEPIQLWLCGTQVLALD